MKLLIIAALFTVGCGNINPLTAGRAVDWTHTAQGCSPRLPLPNMTQSIIVSQGVDGADYTVLYRREFDSVEATFRGGLLCVWDTSDI